MTLVIALMAMALLTALGSAMVVGTMTETAIAAGFRHGTETFYAAEALAAVVVQELAGESDWSTVANGEEVSRFVDGPAAGIRRIGTVTLDLDQATDDVNAAANVGVGLEASYRLYAYGPLADLIPTARGLPTYVLAWVADRSDPAAQDGGEPSVLGLISRAYGPTGSRRSVALSVSRQMGDAGSPPALRIESWHELR